MGVEEIAAVRLKLGLSRGQNSCRGLLSLVFLSVVELLADFIERRVLLHGAEFWGR